MTRRPEPGAVPRRTVLVTGASSGIGAAVAQSLHADGRWRLLLSGRDGQRLAAVAERTGGEAIRADLAAEGGCEHLAAEAVARAGRVDALVAGAGIGWAGPFVTMPPEEIDRVLTVNLTSTLRLVRLLLPPMVARGTGRLVLIGSMAGWVGVGDEAVYSASKGALLTFADSLRRELAGTRVRVSVVSPGAVDTPFFARRGTPYHRRRPRPVSADRVARGCGRHSCEAGRTSWCRGGWRCRRGCTGRRRDCSGPWPTVPTRTAVTEAGARR